MKLKLHYKLYQIKCWFFSNYTLIFSRDKIQDLTFSPQMPNTEGKHVLFDLPFLYDTLLQILYHSFLYCQMETTKEFVLRIMRYLIYREIWDNIFIKHFSIKFELYKYLGYKLFDIFIIKRT